MRKNTSRFLAGMSYDELQQLFLAMLAAMSEDDINKMLWDSLSDEQLGRLDSQFRAARAGMRARLGGTPQ